MTETLMRGIFSLVALVALSLVLGGPAPRLVAAPAELKKLHVLMVFDTNDEGLESSLRIDEWRMKRVLTETIPADRYAVTVLKGDDVTPERILGYYSELKPNSDDALLFFYGGHGATDIDKKHFFDLACGKQLVRADLRKAMEDKKTALVLLLTDCCSTPRKTALVKRKNLDEGMEVKGLQPTARCLFFQARGTVDVTAATDNASWSDNEKGGLFTRSVCRMLKTPVKALDLDRDGFVTWQEFFPQLQKETQIVFKSWSRDLRSRGEKIDTNTQKPHSFNLGNQVVPVVQTCAVLGIENAAAGVLVYRWRWMGGEEWTEVKLEKGAKKVHFLVLNPTQQAMPLFEVEIKGRASGKLRAARWTGKGEPSFDDGEQYRIRARKQRGEGSQQGQTSRSVPTKNGNGPLGRGSDRRWIEELTRRS